MDLVGAIFQHVPFCLYSLRYLKNGLQEAEEQLQKNCLKALQSYTDTKKLGWTWLPGYQSHTMRALPPLQQRHRIQVIIPYKDQKELTLKCIYHLLQQKEVELFITAVNNRSMDHSIAEAIHLLGGEVL